MGNISIKLKSFFSAFMMMSACATQMLQGNSYNTSQYCPPTCCPAEECEIGFITADFLYWTAYEGGFASCGSGQSRSVTNDDNVLSLFKSEIKDPHFQWSPGVRIGAGYQFDNNWDIAAYWTDFNTHANRRGGHYNKLHWKLNFQVVDLLFAYKFDVYSCFSLRPFAGLRGADIYQKVESRQYTAPSYLQLAAGSKEKFMGIGPLIGLEAEWGLACGFSLYADVAVSVLYGHSRNDFCSFEEFPKGANFCRLRQHLDARETAFDAGFGIYWAETFCNSIRLILSLGFEHHCYFNHNRTGKYGDLSLDGGTFAAAVSF